ncbi:MAG: NADH-quinone oxidoreductase subunit C [bacterium]
MPVAASDAAKLQERFPSGIISVKENRGETYVCVHRDRLVDVVTYMRDTLQYDYFVECVGVDYSTWKHARDLSERFEVVYNLFSVPTSSRMFLKVGVDDGQKIPTLMHVFLGAEYPERETQDLFGIVFEGNEAVKNERFLLPDDWVGFPLRKEVPLGGEDVVFDRRTTGPAVEDLQMPHAGESWEGKTGSEDVSGR